MKTLTRLSTAFALALILAGCGDDKPAGKTGGNGTPTGGGNTKTDAGKTDTKTDTSGSEETVKAQSIRGDAGPNADAKLVNWRKLTAADSGSIKVTFKFQGKPVKNKFDPCDEAKGYCKGKHPDGLEMETCVVKNGMVANVFVRISKGLESMKFDPPSDEFVVHQDGCQYKPHVFGVMTNQAVAWLNDDDTGHNVKKDAGINPGFSHGQDKKGGKDVDKFPNEEFMIPIGCNVHGWMNAYMHVVRHPYFAVSGDDGTATIKNVPTGSYTIEFMHELDQSGKIVPDKKTADVTVEAGKTAEVTVTYKRK